LNSCLGGQAALNPLKRDLLKEGRVLSRIVLPPAVHDAQIEPVLEDPEHQILGPGPFPGNALVFQGDVPIVEILGQIHGRLSFQIALKESSHSCGFAFVGHQAMINEVVA
jgi:hypothetical protein